MNERIIPNKLELAIAHAYSTCNKRLLNRLDLELIRIFDIRPSNTLWNDKREAIGIAEINHELLVLWHDKQLGKCKECDGTGEIDAHGRTQTFSIDCPVCDGAGEGDMEFDCSDITITDIDGNLIETDIDIDAFEKFESNCPLAAYNDKQRRIKTASLSQEKL